MNNNNNINLINKLRKQLKTKPLEKNKSKKKEIVYIKLPNLKNLNFRNNTT